MVWGDLKGLPAHSSNIQKPRPIRVKVANPIIIYSIVFRCNTSFAGDLLIWQIIMDHTSTSDAGCDVVSCHRIVHINPQVQVLEFGLAWFGGLIEIQYEHFFILCICIGSCVCIEYLTVLWFTHPWTLSVRGDKLLQIRPLNLLLLSWTRTTMW